MASEHDFELINLNTLILYLSHKGVVLHCTLCGSSDLSVPQISAATGMHAGMRLGSYVNVFKKESIYSPSADQYHFSIVCKKCSNTINIDALPVVAWIKENTATAIGEKNVNT
ncbi:hypothetical protein KU75_16125 [Pectobacterium odoriferum]|uniref:Uncharacterized protein n=1 Tax=Pectobacterium odoriferum TaxID=78398 RepID=A0ABR4VMX7_9GAMM|nr:hypothetical protein [Pectobacterium odoriferum]KGA40745.1 hypothetical protein KU75_16125 [Pectobacterium odoriferum]